MARQHYREGLSNRDRERFAKFLAEDEELVMAVGLSAAYIVEVAAQVIAFPGIIILLLGVGLSYLTHTNLAYGLLIGLIGALSLGVGRAAMVHYGRRYLLTTRRVIIKKGFFVVDLTSALYDKITHIEVIQSFVDRFLMHHGRIIVNTAGSNKQEIVLDNIDHPIEFKNILERLINREREHLGRTTGPISTIEGELVD